MDGDAPEEPESNPEAASSQERLNTNLVEAQVADNSEAPELLKKLIERMNESKKGGAALSKLTI